MAPTSSLLLLNGTVLLHDEDDHVNPVKANVLIIDNKIVEIAPSIAPRSDTIQIDCTGKIISPGFVDTHHHLWQTQLKGRHANDLLLDYMFKGQNLNQRYVVQVLVSNTHCREFCLFSLHARRRILGRIGRMYGGNRRRHNYCCRPCA